MGMHAVYNILCELDCQDSLNENCVKSRQITWCGPSCLGDVSRRITCSSGHVYRTGFIRSSLPSLTEECKTQRMNAWPVIATLISFTLHESLTYLTYTFHSMPAGSRLALARPGGSRSDSPKLQPHRISYLLACLFARGYRVCRLQPGSKNIAADPARPVGWSQPMMVQV